MRYNRGNVPNDVFKHIDMTGGPDACWPWKGGTGGGSGRGKTRPYFAMHGRKFIAYRIVYALVKGVDLQSSQLLCHSCDNSICCNPEHLSIGDNQSNMAEMNERDRHGLPSHTVRRIRILLAQGNDTHEQIGEKFAVSRSVVTKINNHILHTNEADYPSEEDINNAEETNTTEE